MPFDASDLSKLPPAQTLQFWSAVADALIAAFKALKTDKGVAGQWDKRDDLIMEMQSAAPAAYERTLDAFNARMAELRPISDQMVATGNWGG